MMFSKGSLCILPGSSSYFGRKQRHPNKACYYNCSFPLKPINYFYCVVIRRSIVRTTGAAGDVEKEDKKRLVQVVEDGAAGVRAEIVEPGDRGLNQL